MSFLAIALVFVLALLLAGIIASFYSFIIGAPYFWTPKKAILESFKIAGLKPGDKLYELGAGNGKALILAEKEFDLKGIGFELSPLMYLVAKLNLFLRGNKNTKLYFKNFYKEDLSGADLIFCFLSVTAMKKLKSKFEIELRPGTKIISYCFSIPGWTAKKTVKGKHSGFIYFYQI